jgi:peptidyl-tRNA hydrolase
MKLLIIFDKNIELSPEKICVHVGHSNRNITTQLFVRTDINKSIWDNWLRNSFKSVLLRDKIKENIINKIKEFKYFYEIYDAGLDGVFTPGTVLGYAVLVPESNETFKRLRTLKF